MAQKPVTQQLFFQGYAQPVKEWRRASRRRHIRETVYVRRLGDDREIYAFTMDVGPQSVGLQCREALQPGEVVELRCGLNADDWYCFEVRHCSPLITGYKIGMIAREQQN